MDIPRESDVKKYFLESASDRNRKEEEIIKIQKLTGDASIRSYFRVLTKDQSYVLSIGNPKLLEETNRDFLEIQEVLLENAIRVPKVYFSNLKLGLIVQEDLSDRTFLSELNFEKNEEKEILMYKKAIDQMVLIQQIDVPKYAEKCFEKRSFDRKKLNFEVNLAHENFLRKYLRYDLNQEENQILEDAFNYLITQIIKGKHVLSHRDYHSRNIMMKEDQQVVIDFQDARMGIPQYDLVSLLEDCYYKISEKNKRTLRDYYFDKFISPEKIQSREEFDKAYYLMAIQRIYKAIGSFTFINNEKKDPRYLRYIGSAFESLILFTKKSEELQELRKLWEKIYYES